MPKPKRWILQYHVLMTFYWNGLAGCLFQFESKFGRSGNFSSPHFPSMYTENVECFYMFVGHEFETIRISFLLFELEPPYTKGCLTDYVDISTTTASNVKQLVGRYCGSNIPSPLVSMHPRVEIIFRSNHIYQHKGFHGTFEFYDEENLPPPDSTEGVPDCGGTMSGVGGVIISPGYPQSFPKDVECVWLIRVDRQKLIYVRILELQLYGSIANCGEAELSIYDGYSTFDVNPEIMKRYCGDLKYYKNVEERTQMSRRNRFLIRFKTSIGSEQKGQSLDKIIGFKLVWTAVEFEYEGYCNQHVCRESHYCMNSISSACAHMPKYCVHKSLVCNGLPNCSEDDYSDEDKCNLPLLAGCGSAIGAFVVLLCIGVSLCRRNASMRKSMSQTQELTLQLRQLEHSPSFVPRQTIGGGDFFHHMEDLHSPMVDHHINNCSIHSGIHTYLDGIQRAPYTTKYPTNV